ncbi:MAG: hypothetical protein HYS23_01335 [Geobacter sp.]|nr:hypothetical protein [Geobacter sp.]
MTKFFNSTDDGLLLNTMNIHSIIQVSPNSKYRLDSMNNPAINQYGIYCLYQIGNEAKTMSLIDISYIELMADVAVDRNKGRAIVRNIQIDDEKERLLTIMTAELRRSLSGSDPVINVWDVMAKGLNDYYDDAEITL